MPRYLIELPHNHERQTCEKMLRAIEQFGSHFVTSAEWGCKDGVHTGYLIADLADRSEALRIVPPQFRAEARVIELSRFTRDEIVVMARKTLAG